jgi:thioredoxin reductase
MYRAHCAKATGKFCEGKRTALVGAAPSPARKGRELTQTMKRRKLML